MRDQWTAVDAYLNDLLVRPDGALAHALASSDEAGLPAIAVSAPQGKFLMLLARAMRARRVLEIGTLGGYSTIWLARGIAPGGQLVTLELASKHAVVAAANVARAGLSEVVQVRVGPAAESLRRMAAEQDAAFDLVFIDADKGGYPEYLELVLALVHPGSVIIADNIVRDGKVTDSASSDPDVQGVRRFNELVAANPRLSATVIQTVGGKGYDGFAMIVVQ